MYMLYRILPELILIASLSINGHLELLTRNSKQILAHCVLILNRSVAWKSAYTCSIAPSFVVVNNSTENRYKAF